MPCNYFLQFQKNLVQEDLKRAKTKPGIGIPREDFSAGPQEWKMQIVPPPPKDSIKRKVGKVNKYAIIIIIKHTNVRTREYIKTHTIKSRDNSTHINSVLILRQ